MRMRLRNANLPGKRPLCQLPIPNAATDMSQQLELSTLKCQLFTICYGRGTG